LVALGFDKMDAAQAFFVCDKNENAAANLLIESSLHEQQTFNQPKNTDKKDDNKK